MFRSGIVVLESWEIRIRDASDSCECTSDWQGTSGAIAHHRPANKHFLSGYARCFPTFREARLVASLKMRCMMRQNWLMNRQGCSVKSRMCLNFEHQHFTNKMCLFAGKKKHSFDNNNCWKRPTRAYKPHSKSRPLVHAWPMVDFRKNRIKRWGQYVPISTA